MLSRVANTIYWMSRYLERADNVARFIDVNIRLMLDMGSERTNAQWQPLINTSGDAADFARRYPQADERNVIQFLTFDADNPNSIFSCIEKARGNARTVQEMISSELWEAINEFYHWMQHHSRKRQIDDLQSFYSEIKKNYHLITGIIENTMSRDQGWHFAHMGQMLERADKTARLIDMKYFLLLPTTEVVGSAYDVMEWGTVLKSANGLEMYCKQFHRVHYQQVIRFLLFDPLFPRSIYYCINAAADSLQAILSLLQINVPVAHAMTQLQTSFKQTQLETIFSQGLHEFLDDLQCDLNRIDQAIYQEFFSH